MPACASPGSPTSSTTSQPRTTRRDIADAKSAALPATRAATTESGEPTPTCGIVGKTVWYRLLALTTRTVTITTQGSTFDTVIAVYQGPSLGTLTQRACNDQDPGQPSVPGTSSLTVSLTAGQEYWLQVGGALGAGGDLVVTVR